MVNSLRSIWAFAWATSRAITPIIPLPVLDLARIIHGGHEVCMGRVISAGLTAGFQGEF